MNMKRMCYLLLYEVPVKHELCYKGGKLEGVAIHSECREKDSLTVATTIQTVMIST